MQSTRDDSDFEFDCNLRVARFVRLAQEYRFHRRNAMLFLRLSAGLVQVADTIEVLDVCVGQKHTMHMYIVHSALWSP